MSKIKKAVIPAAGLGTRFLPATKTVPKEMLTIVDAPIILYVVEEAVQAGIEDIVLIAGRGKQAIEDFFDSSFELEDHLEKTKQLKLLDRLIRIRNSANIISIRQKQALGLGHAIHCASPVLGQESFAVLLGDEITDLSTGANMTAKLCKVHEATGSSVVSVMTVDDRSVSKYGIAELEDENTPWRRVLSMVEKPDPQSIRSRWALTGRYVFDNSLLEILGTARPTLNGEIQLTDSLNKLLLKKPVMAVPFEGDRFDAGDRLGYLKANVELGLRNHELSNDFRQYLTELVNGWKR